MKTIFFTFLIGIFCIQITTAQTLDDKKLNLYKPGNTKILPYKIGDEITFKMKDFENYYDLKILDLRSDSIIFGGGVVRLEQIEAIKYPRAFAPIAKKAAGSLFVFGASWPVYTAIDKAYGGESTWAGAGIVAVTSGALGFLFTRFTRPKKIVLDEDHYLRILIP